MLPTGIPDTSFHFLSSLLFATPVIYPSSIVPSRRWLINLNPIAGLITAFRSSLLNTAILWSYLVISVAVSIALFIMGIVYFTPMNGDCRYDPTHNTIIVISVSRALSIAKGQREILI